MASMRQQQRRRFKIAWKWAILVSAVLGVALWVGFDDRWYVMGNDLQVLGASSNAMIMEVAVASDVLGWHSFHVRPKIAAARVLEQVPGVVAVEAECTWFPASCVFQITEREPVLMWVTTQGEYGVDQEGTVFPVLETLVISNDTLPVVHGEFPVYQGEEDTEQIPWIPPEVMEGVMSLIALGVPSDALLYQSQRGLVWIDAEGRQIVLGIGADMESRWRIYEALSIYLDERGIFPWSIDVRFPKGPTYSLDRIW